MIGAGMSTGISPFALLWPTFALVALILAVWLALVVKRLRHVKANPPTRNLANLFEMPVLYFALVPLLLMFRQVTTAQLALAWIYVILRTIHSMIHLGPNAIRPRFQVYLVSVAVLAAMWVGFFVDALRGARLYAIHEVLMAQL